MIAKMRKSVPIIVMVIGVLGITGPSYAASVNGLIDAIDPGVPATWEIADLDISMMLDTAGGTEIGVPRVGAVMVGDVIYGTIGISSIFQGATQVQPGLANVVPASPNEELSGFYAMSITGISGTAISAGPMDGPTLAAVFPGLAPTWGAYGFGGAPGTGAMVAMFTEFPADYQESPAVSPGVVPPAAFVDAVDYARAADGTFWASYGAGTYTLTDTVAGAGAIFDTTLASAAPSSTHIATITFSLVQKMLGSSILNFSTPLVPGITGANVLKGGSGGLPLSDVALQATATVIPLPPAAWAGMVLLGALGLGRKLRRR